MPCEFDMCPHHAYRGNQAYGFNKVWQTTNIEEFEIEDPHWEKYQRIAQKDGVSLDEQETEYYSLGVDKTTGKKVSNLPEDSDPNLQNEESVGGLFSD